MNKEKTYYISKCKYKRLDNMNKIVQGGFIIDAESQEQAMQIAQEKFKCKIIEGHIKVV
jgi:hypothetical protein